jgi:hypothetical protein
MIALYWLRSLFRVAPGRTLATAAGIALAVAFAATLAIFVISASYTMRARAIANVPVDWQVELGPGIDRTAVETALDQAGVTKLIRPVGYARVEGFAAATGDTQQVTGPGQAIGIPPDYLTAFPNQITLLSGSFDGRFCAARPPRTCMRGSAMRSVSLGPVLRRRPCGWPPSRQSRTSTRCFELSARPPDSRRTTYF